MLRRIWHSIFGKASPPPEELEAEHRELEEIKMQGTRSFDRARNLERDLRLATTTIRRERGR
jgi:hypothetical protein